MRYIRTEDGIFEVVKEDGDWLEITSNFERKMQCHCVIKKHAIIKQADTIEELCDAIVRIEKDRKPFSVNMLEGRGVPPSYIVQEFRKHMAFTHKPRKKDNVILGAIWTDKGLIYVAKMNEKGELELL